MEMWKDSKKLGECLDYWNKETEVKYLNKAKQFEQFTAGWVPTWWKALPSLTKDT